VRRRFSGGFQDRNSDGYSLRLATIFLPVSIRGLGHVFGRIAKPTRFSILQITENLFSLALIAEMKHWRALIGGVVGRRVYS
jgi:hypothetical protein